MFSVSRRESAHRNEKVDVQDKRKRPKLECRGNPGQGMGHIKYSGVILLQGKPFLPSSFLPPKLKSKDIASSVSDLVILTKVIFHIFKLFCIVQMPIIPTPQLMALPYPLLLSLK